MLWLWIGCARVGIPMPGSTRHLNQRIVESTEETSIVDKTEVEELADKGREKALAQEDAAPISVESTEETSTVDKTEVEEPIDKSRGEVLAQEATRLIGKTRLSVNGKSGRYDCSGFILAVHRLNNIDLSGNTRSMFEQAKERNGIFLTNPLPGDVVFFDNTYDRNRNGKRDDELSHIAIVQRVEEDQTVQMVHLGGSGIVPISMNLQYPAQTKDETGKRLNSYLRVQRRGDTNPRLAGQLFRGYARFW